MSAAVIEHPDPEAPLVTAPSVPGTKGLWDTITGAFGLAAEGAGAGIVKRAQDNFLKSDTPLDEKIAKIIEGAAPEQRADVERFLGIVTKDPEMKEAFGAMLKDEGLELVQGFQALMTEDGTVSLDNLEEALRDPSKRDLIVGMMQKVATSEHNSADAVNFTRLALAAARDPVKNGSAFLKLASDMGLDTSKVQQESAMEMLKDFWNDPGKALAQFFSQMDMPPEMQQMLTGIFSPLVAFMKDTVDYYAHGTDNQPGLIEIGRRFGQEAQETGAEEFRRAGIQTAQGPAPALP